MAEFRIDAGTAMLSEIAINHAETLFCGGTRTMAALCDLAEVIETVALYDNVLVASTAAAGASFLEGVDGILAPVVAKDELASEIGRRQAAGDEVALTFLRPMGYAQLMADDPVLWALVDPAQLEAGRDRGAYFLGKFPLFMFLALMQRGLVNAEPGAAETLAEAVDDTVALYRGRIGSCRELTAACGGTFVASVLEQPLMDLARIDAVAEGEDVVRLREELKGAIDWALIDSRKLCLEEWRMPAIGLFVLGQAARLEDVPRLINEARDRFAALRADVNRLEREYRQLMEEGVDGSVEYAVAVEWPKRERELRAAYEAFARQIDDGRTRGTVERTEYAVSLLGFLRSLAPEALALAGGAVAGAAVGVLQKAWTALGLDDRITRRAKLARVRGLCGAASFFNQRSARAIKGVDGIVLRHAGTPRVVLERQRLVLGQAFQLCTAIARGDAGPQRLALVGPGGDKVELSAGEFWLQFARNDDLRRMLLDPA